MDTNIIVSGGRGELVSPYDGFAVPAIVADLGDEAIEHFVNFFTAEIENDNTKEAYGRAVAKFLQACEKKGLGLREIKPVTVAGYIKSLGKGKQHEVTSVKLYLAAIKRFFDYSKNRSIG